jgi:arsenate reductase (glutaredoxin)
MLRPCYRAGFRTDMEKKITVYEKPTCTTCRKLNKLFDENRIDGKKVNYFIEPFDEKKLGSLLRKTGMRPFDVLRRNEPDYKLAGIDKDSPDRDVIAAMVKYPSIIQRPIVEVGDKAVLARPIEKALEIL